MIDALASSCYYLHTEKNRYRFRLTPNLNKLLADRRANIPAERIDERARDAVRDVFEAKPAGVEVVCFPEKSNLIPDRPVLTVVVAAPTTSMADEVKTRQQVEALTREYGGTNRTFKSALVWCVPDSAVPLAEDARKLLALAEIDNQDRDHLDDTQRRQLGEQLGKARKNLKETVWRTYKHVLLYGKDNAIQARDLGLVHSSAATDLVGLVLNRLQQEGEVVPSGVSPAFLVRHWPPAFKPVGPPTATAPAKLADKCRVKAGR